MLSTVFFYNTTSSLHDVPRPYRARAKPRRRAGIKAKAPLRVINDNNLGARNKKKGEYKKAVQPHPSIRKKPAQCRGSEGEVETTAVVKGGIGNGANRPSLCPVTEFPSMKVPCPLLPVPDDICAKFKKIRDALPQRVEGQARSK